MKFAKVLVVVNSVKRVTFSCKSRSVTSGCGGGGGKGFGDVFGGCTCRLRGANIVEVKVFV